MTAFKIFSAVSQASTWEMSTLSIWNWLSIAEERLSSESIKWERLYYLNRGGAHDQVVQLATQNWFRSQLFGLRSLKAIQMISGCPTNPRAKNKCLSIGSFGIDWQ